MAEKQINQVDDSEQQAVDNLPTRTVTAEALASAVPKFKEWTIGKLFTEFGAKDGILIYHFYHTDRKAIFDTATSKMEERLSAEVRQSVSEAANGALEDISWWPYMESCIMSAIADHFRDTPANVKYIPEVDSWSVVMPMVSMPLGVQSPEHIAAFVLNVAHRLGQVEIAKDAG
jgi:hypothetical protein